MTQFTIANKTTRETYLSETVDGDVIADLFSSRQEAEEHISYSDARDNLIVVPLDDDDLEPWAMRLHDECGVTTVITHIPGNPHLNQNEEIKSFVISLRLKDARRTKE